MTSAYQQLLAEGQAFEQFMQQYNNKS